MLAVDTPNKKYSNTLKMKIPTRFRQKGVIVPRPNTLDFTLHRTRQQLMVLMSL